MQPACMLYISQRWFVDMWRFPLCVIFITKGETLIHEFINEALQVKRHNEHSMLQTQHFSHQIIVVFSFLIGNVDVFEATA